MLCRSCTDIYPPTERWSYNDVEYSLPRHFRSECLPRTETEFALLSEFWIYLFIYFGFWN